MAGNADVAALVGAGWVGEADFPRIPQVKEKPASIVYGPLASLPVAPDVIYLRLNAKQAMVLDDALGRRALRGQAAVPRARHRQGRRRDGDQRRLHAEPGQDRHAERRDVLRHPGGEARRGGGGARRNAETERAVAGYAAADAARFA